MKQTIKETRERDFVEDRIYELPECSFKFVYIQAISPDYAEELVDQLNKTQEE